jgi:hypothetical protein
LSGASISRRFTELDMHLSSCTLAEVNSGGRGGRQSAGSPGSPARCSERDAAIEGFFGRLKNEFFRGRDWSGVPVGEFVRRLDRWMGWYRSGRLREFREGGAVVWDTIDGRRARLGLAV